MQNREQVALRLRFINFIKRAFPQENGDIMCKPLGNETTQKLLSFQSEASRGVKYTDFRYTVCRPNDVIVLNELLAEFHKYQSLPAILVKGKEIIHVIVGPTEHLDGMDNNKAVAVIVGIVPASEFDNIELLNN